MDLLGFGFFFGAEVTSGSSASSSSSSSSDSSSSDSSPLSLSLSSSDSLLSFSSDSSSSASDSSSFLNWDGLGGLLWLCFLLSRSAGLAEEALADPLDFVLDGAGLATRRRSFVSWRPRGLSSNAAICRPPRLGGLPP